MRQQHLGGVWLNYKLVPFVFTLALSFSDPACLCVYVVLLIRVL